MAKTVAQISLPIIGHFRTNRTNKSALPRQAKLSNSSGYIEFLSGFDHKLALTGLEKMSHCWLIFIFHEAGSKAKPVVRPPRAPQKQVGVYATRAPYRPSPVGLSLVQIEKIENGRLYLKACDLLKDTPILDIKPYVATADTPEGDIRQGWIDEIQNWSYTLSSDAKKQIQWLKKEGLAEIEDVLQAQLTTSPFQESRKRITFSTDGLTAILSYKTWRLKLQVSKENFEICVVSIFSGYSQQEMKNKNDPYSDKDLHRRFTKCFV